MTMDPRSWKRGDVLLHRSGGVAVIDRRKNDDSGWWMIGGGGLDDWVAVSGSWLLLTKPIAARLFAEETASV